MAAAEENGRTEESEPDTLGPLEFLRLAASWLRPYWKHCLLILLFVFAEVGFYMILSIFFKAVFDNAIPEKNLAYLGTLTQWLLILFVVAITVELLEGGLTGRLSAKVMRDLRQKMFRHLQRLPLGFYTHTPVGDILSRFTTDLSMIEQTMTISLYRLCFHTTAFLAGTSLLFYFEWHLAIVTMFTFPLIAVGPKLLGGAASQNGYARKQEDSTTTSLVQENVLAQRVIRAFGLQSSYLGKFQNQLGVLHSISRRTTHSGTVSRIA